MKPSKLLKLFLAVTTISSFSFAPSVVASNFSETEVDQNKFVAVAAPYRHGYNLMILEQIPGQRPCWNETGANPTIVEPLFLEFDFTNSCIRSSDSNNYSIRFEGEDLGLDYLLNVVEREGELHLVGTPRDSSKPELHLGQTNGLSSGSLKIELDSQWRLTKRNYNGSTTAHIYLSNSSRSYNANLTRQSSARLAAPYQAQSQYSNYSENIRQPPVNYTVQQQPVSYPVQQQPVNNGYYQQPVSYPAPQQQPVNNGYQQPVSYPAPQQQPVNNGYQQPVSYPAPQQQPVNSGYQQPVSYPALQQQPVNSGYQQPVSYPALQQQPVNNGYQQPVSYPAPHQQPVNSDRRSLTYSETSTSTN